MQNPKMHSTSCMFLRTQAQGTMNTCEAELRDLCLSKTRPFNAKATSRGTKLTEGQKHISQGTQSFPVSALLYNSKQGRRRQVSLSVVTLGMGCWLRQESRRDSVCSPGDRKWHCCTWRARLCAQPISLGRSWGMQSRLLQSHAAERGTHTTGGRGPFAWRCIPPAPGASAPAARPAPAGTGSGAAGPAWQCRRCA